MKARPTPLEEALRTVHQGRHYLWTSVYLLAGSRLMRAASVGPETSCENMALGEGIVGLTARTGEGWVVGDVGAEPAYRAVLPQTKSEIAMPIKIGAHVLGVVNVESDKSNAFGSQDRVLIKNVAAQLARFLTGKGKYLMTKTAGSALATQFDPVKQQPRSELPKDMRAAVGAKTPS